MLKPINYLYLFVLITIMLFSPVSASAGQALDESSNGGLRVVVVGQTMELILESNPSTGYSWQYFPDFTGIGVIEEAAHDYRGGNSGLIGASGREYWSFKAVGAGTASISLGYMRPWESVQPEKIFKLNIIVTPQQVAVMVNGKAINTDVPPMIREDRTLAPLRAAAEALGAEVNWVPATQQVIIKKGDLTLELTVGSSEALRKDPEGEHYITLDVPAEIIAGRFFVPLRFFSEALGCQVDWDAATHTVSITD